MHVVHGRVDVSYGRVKQSIRNKGGPFLGDEIKTLPQNRQIGLVSQAMQSAAQATAVLRILGYKAFVLRQGLVSWNPTFKPPVPHHHYALVKST